MLQVRKWSCRLAVVCAVVALACCRHPNSQPRAVEYFSDFDEGFACREQSAPQRFWTDACEHSLLELRSAMRAHAWCQIDADCIVSVQFPPHRECCYAINRDWWEIAKDGSESRAVELSCGVLYKVCRCGPPKCAQGKCVVDEPLRIQKPPTGDCRNPGYLPER